jgi:deazaflavin-dependent oxidoreductase (nitroreductase family)
VAIDKIPAGTRGAKTPPKALLKALLPLMQRIHRRKGDTFRGSPLLYLTTVGAKSGQERTHPLARFDDGRGGWWVCASFGGAQQHPAWYLNIVAHPDQVKAEVNGKNQRVQVEQLDGADYDEAWASIVSQAKNFAGYRKNTDRVLPVLRLTPLND